MAGHTKVAIFAVCRLRIGNLPQNKKATINGKEYTDYTWFLLHALLRLRTPSDILIILT
jgi:hypothetical protein